MKTMTMRMLSTLLILSLCLSSVLYAGAAEPERLSVFVASDIHYRPPSELTPMAEANFLPGDPLFHHANTKGMLTYEADAVIDEFLARFEASDAQFLLIPGDLSEEGHWAEHLGLAEKLRACIKRSGKNIFVMPGNHDIRTSNSKGRLDLEDFLEVYADIGYNRTLARHKGTASYTAELNGDYRLIAIDACVYREDGSYLSPELLAWTQEQAAQAKQDGKHLVAMVHFSVLEHFGLESVGGSLLCVDQYRSFAEQLAGWGVQYVFTGHEHANDISSAVTKKGSKIYDIETGSLITYPCAYREVTFSDAAVDIKTNYIDKIDTSLLPEGFSSAQIAAMEANFTGYALDYFRAGFRSYAYMIPELTQTLAESLNAPEGSAGYQTIDAAVRCLEEAAGLPMYSTGSGTLDSVEALAKKGGTALAKSDYQNLLDLAGRIYAMHYAGDENLSMDSLEVKLLGQAINAVLVYALTNLPIAAANGLLAAFGLPGFPYPSAAASGAGARVIYAKSAAKVVTRELVNTLAQGIFTDWSAPGDLNVTLEPYGSAQPVSGYAVKITGFSYAMEIIRRLLLTTYRIMKNIWFVWEW